MILTSEDNFQNKILQDLIAQSYEEFFHDLSEKRLDVSLTKNPSLVLETKVDTKLLKLFTLFHHQAYSTNLQV